jgi:hypothetical protein
LREHHIGRELGEQPLVDLIQAPAVAQSFGDRMVDFARRQTLQMQRGPADDRERLHRGGIIALVGTANEVVARTERAGDLGSGWEKGDNAHRLWKIAARCIESRSGWQKEGRVMKLPKKSSSLSTDVLAIKSDQQ